MGIEVVHPVKYRYPGTKFFEPDQHDIFFGREQETRQLVHAIKAHEIFVIFADSGIGKTSLLNAGLIPELKKEFIEPVKFRFQNTDIPPLQSIFNKLAEYSNSLPASTGQSLWRLFKCCHFNNNPLFIFDQFEEFFNHPKQEREKCIDELGSLANEYLPDYIREEMREKFKVNDPTLEELQYYSPARLNMLFLIRADKLKLLDDLSKKIPLILRNRFHLKPLNANQAEQAILTPASLPQNGFASPSFGFEKGAAKEICDYLKNEEDEVESFQLQILCQELEKRIIERYKNGNISTPISITEKELGGEAGMESITKNYYTNQINSIPEAEMRNKAIKLIEDELIVEDRRISLPENFLIRNGYSKELLDYLLNTTRLIRVDNDRFYEISHDRLLPSIIKSRRQRDEEDEKAKKIRELERQKEEQEQRNLQLQKEKNEQERYLKLEQTSKIRNRRWLIIVILLLLGFLIAFNSSNKANNKAKILIVNNLINNHDYDEADGVLNKKNLFSLFSFSARDTLRKLNEIINSGKEKKHQYDLLRNRADSLARITDSLLINTDSLLAKVNSAVGQDPLKRIADFKVDGRNLIETISGTEERLRDSWNSYKNAQDTLFIKPVDEEGTIVGKRNIAEKSIPQAFKLCIDASYVLLNAGYKEEARKAYVEATKIDSFAKRHFIDLDAYDKSYLDSLQINFKK